MSANRLTNPKQRTKCHGRSCGRPMASRPDPSFACTMDPSNQQQRPNQKSAGGAGELAKGSALDPKVVADAVGHRQIARVQLGGERLKCDEQSSSCHVCLLYTSPSPRD